MSNLDSSLLAGIVIGAALYVYAQVDNSLWKRAQFFYEDRGRDLRRLGFGRGRVAWISLQWAVTGRGR